METSGLPVVSTREEERRKVTPLAVVEVMWERRVRSLRPHTILDRHHPHHDLNLTTRANFSAG